jgi:hypothetical protein
MFEPLRGSRRLPLLRGWSHIKYTERLAAAGIEPSIGSVGDSSTPVPELASALLLTTMSLISVAVTARNRKRSDAQSSRRRKSV